MSYKSHIGLLMVLFLSMISFAVQAQETFKKVEDTHTLRKDIRKANQNAESLQSPFIQEKHLSFLDEVVISEGMFYFKKKNRLRWEYYTPFSYIIVIDGNKISIDDEGHKKEFDASTNPMFAEINKIMMGIVSGELLENNKFDVDYFTSATAIRLILIPKDESIGSFISMIQMDLDNESMLVDKIKMIESTDDYTLISFTEKRINIEIPETVFSLD